MADSSEKVVVITGCSSGIGLATAVLLAKEDGYRVLATMRNLTKKDALIEAAGQHLNRTMFIRELDVSKEESIMAFLKYTYNHEGRIDVLVNNAGVGVVGIFEHVTREQMESIFQTNFFGAVRLTQEVVRDMKKRRAGKIIFISSILGVTANPSVTFYSATKYAIEGLVNSIAPIMRYFNISVTSVQPGPINTPIYKNVNANDLGKADVFDSEYTIDPRADIDTNECSKKIWDAMRAYFTEVMEPVEGAVDVIKKCIQDDHPPVRVQTSASSEELVRSVLVDPTGNKARDLTLAILQ